MVKGDHCYVRHCGCHFFSLNYVFPLFTSVLGGDRAKGGARRRARHQKLHIEVDQRGRRRASASAARRKNFRFDCRAKKTSKSDDRDGAVVQRLDASSSVRHSIPAIFHFVAVLPLQAESRWGRRPPDPAAPRASTAWRSAVGPNLQDATATTAATAATPAATSAARCV